MSMQFPRWAQYSHPRHGIYGSPSEVLADGRLSETEKQMVIEAWRSFIEHGAAEEADRALIPSTLRSLDTAAERLAAGTT